MQRVQGKIDTHLSLVNHFESWNLNWQGVGAVTFNKAFTKHKTESKVPRIIQPNLFAASGMTLEVSDLYETLDVVFQNAVPKTHN
jgi:hypothetical protein